MSGKPSLTIKRRLNAPPAKVYEAWTDPAKMMRWFGPDQAETLRAETDPKVGGRFRVLMRTSDGEEHDVSGVYREVVRDEKLVFTWAWRSTPEREVAGDGGTQGRRRRHIADADARAILRRSGARRSSRGLDRGYR